MACRWQLGMKITALLDALNSALAEPFSLAWVSDSPRFLLVFTVIYAVAVIVAVTDQKNTRPGADKKVCSSANSRAVSSRALPSSSTSRVSGLRTRSR